MAQTSLLGAGLTGGLMGMALSRVRFGGGTQQPAITGQEPIATPGTGRPPMEEQAQLSHEVPNLGT